MQITTFNCTKDKDCLLFLQFKESNNMGLLYVTLKKNDIRCISLSFLPYQTVYVGSQIGFIQIRKNIKVLNCRMTIYVRIIQVQCRILKIIINVQIMIDLLSLK